MVTAETIVLIGYFFKKEHSIKKSDHQPFYFNPAPSLAPKYYNIKMDKRSTVFGL